MLKDKGGGRKFDPHEVSKKIKELTENDKLREDISYHNREYAKNYFYPEKVAKRLENIYEKLLLRNL